MNSSSWASLAEKRAAQLTEAVLRQSCLRTCLFVMAVHCAGYYAAISQDPLDAFASDVTGALENYRVAVRRSGTEFAASMAEKKSSDLADVALTVLKSLVEEHKTRLAKQAQLREGLVNSGSASIDGQRGNGETEPELNRAERTIVDDLSRYASANMQNLLPMA